MTRKLTPIYAETLILLNLWASEETEIPKSSFVPSSKSSVYKEALERLESNASLVMKQKNKRTRVYSLTERGKKHLTEGINNRNFSFTNQVGAKTANALLNWFRMQQDSSVETKLNGYGKITEIQSYDEFVDIFFKTYEYLNDSYNLGDLVPIYRLRREIKDRVSRTQFNKWILDIQGNDLVQLMGGELANATSDQREDSISIPGGGLRFYVKRL